MTFAAARLAACFFVFGLHLPVYAAIAIAGIIAALWLSLHTAPHAGLPPDKLWDAGVFAVIAAFVISRAMDFLLLLLIEHGQDTLSFREVLSFSSISYLSLLVTAIPVMLWLRWKRLPLLRVMDAWSPCAALLWAALSIAEVASGGGLGLPTRLPWGIHSPISSTNVRLQPVAIYAAIVALALCAALLHLIRRMHSPGRIAGIALAVSGVASFLLDMLHLPEQPLAHTWLDAVQWISLAGIGFGSCLLTLPTHREAA
ncbi:MAG TPA: prolipoprotein diacylglyceryl transferase family protein [Candidatus Aquilonibacter sp.]|nr:prolipoprotein diacylglyceryl transferase family protein [Candidatus Aquilonibacter sp.]